MTTNAFFIAMASSYRSKSRVLLLLSLTILMTLISAVLMKILLSSSQPSSDLLLLQPHRDNSTWMQSRPGAHGMHRTDANVVYTVNAGDESLSSSKKTFGQPVIHSERQRDIDHFFDCHSTKSKCTYFYPGEFNRHYFDNLTTRTNAFSSNNDIQNHNNISNEEYLTRTKDRIGLNNANLPALDSFSWWMKRSIDERRGGTTTNYVSANVMNMIQYHYHLPLQNITYIHVHKCGGTSIQGALYRRARHLRNMAFRVVNNYDDDDDNARHLHPQQRYEETTQMRENQDTVFIELQADVHAYRHSFGGGSLRKKEMWDAERLNHIHAMYDSQQSSLSTHTSSVSSTLQKQQQITNSTTSFQQQKQSMIHTQIMLPQYPSPHAIFTIVRDPIQRFLSAIQQVMQYNVEFRQKCLFEDNEKEGKRIRRDNQRQSFFLLPSSPMLFKWRRKEYQEGETYSDQTLMAQRQQLLRRQTIQCSITDMELTKYRKDVHLQPMASHFRLLDYTDGIKNGNDAIAATHTIPDEMRKRGSDSNANGGVSKGIAVSVFSMDDIHHVLTHLLGGSNQHDDDTKVKTSTIHMRDRSNEEYATSPILSQLSSSDCDENMIRQICTLYHIDVELMKWLGFGGEAVERC